MTEQRDNDPLEGAQDPDHVAYVRLPSSLPPALSGRDAGPESLDRISIEPEGSGTARVAWGSGGFTQGARFGAYEIVGQIATGGMATVYLARTAHSGELVAIKKIHPHLEREENFAKMFLDEARIASRINHPNVVRARAMENLNGLCLVMDYVDGEQLRKFMQTPGTPNGRIPLPIALRIASDMLHGLHAAHELRDGAGSILGVVHRDVSPQNVLVGRDGVTRVTDFGIARARGRLAVTREGLVRGKLRYMAPEQARPQGSPPDRRADVFAAGIIIWEMLSGKRLFRGDEAAVIDKLLNTPTPKPRPNDGDLDPAIEAAVMLSLERDPAHRHATALMFARALERAALSIECLADHDAVQFFVEAVIGPRTQDPVLHPEQEMGQVTDIEVMFSANRGIKRPSLKPPPPIGVSEAHTSWPAPPMREPEPTFAPSEPEPMAREAPESLTEVDPEPQEPEAQGPDAQGPHTEPDLGPSEEPAMHDASHVPVPLVTRRDPHPTEPAPEPEPDVTPEPEPAVLRGPSPQAALPSERPYELAGEPHRPLEVLAVAQEAEDRERRRRRLITAAVVVMWVVVVALAFGVWRVSKRRPTSRPMVSAPVSVQER